MRRKLEQLLPRKRCRAPKEKQKAKEPRRFKYVHWHSTSRLWVAQRNGEPSPGSHANQRRAAQLAAKAWHVPLSELRIRPARSSRRQYKHITYHKKSKTWIARYRGKSLGSNTSQAAAATLVAKYLHVPLITLRLRSAPGPLESHQQLAARCRGLWSAFGGLSPRNPKVPGDLADLIQRGLDKGSRVLSQAPGLVVPFLLAKFTPHRDAIEEAWAEHVAKDPKGYSRDPVMMTYNVLRDSLQRLHREPLSQEWIDNVGRNTMYHGGLFPFANRSLGILMPAQEAAASRLGALRLGQNGRPFLLVKLTDTLKRNISTLISFGKALLACKPPRDAHDWANEINRLQGAVLSSKVCGLQSGVAYRTMWVIRCWLIWRMRCCGLTSLRIPPGLTVAEFAHLFPDEKKWIFRVAGRRQHKLSVKALFSKVLYNGPPELFSMFCCLWGNADLRRQLQRLGSTWLAAHRATLRQATLRCLCYLHVDWHRAPLDRSASSCTLFPVQVCEEYEKVEGQVPHPFTLIMLAERQILRQS